jgi:hypothetical protein
MCHNLIAFKRCEVEMNPPRTPKPSGAELAARLSGTAFPKISPEPSPQPVQPVQQDIKPKAAARGGRPSKTVGDAIPVNVRLALDDHAALGRIASELHIPGRPVPTVQDIVRGLVRGALQDHETLKTLVQKGGI